MRAMTICSNRSACLLCTDSFRRDNMSWSTCDFVENQSMTKASQGANNILPHECLGGLSVEGSRDSSVRHHKEAASQDNSTNKTLLGGAN